MLRIMVEATFETDNRTGKKWYGPIALPEHHAPMLHPKQSKTICSMCSGTRPFLQGCFFWLAQCARHNARHALDIGRGLSRPYEVSRLLQRGSSDADEVLSVRSTRSKPARRFFPRRMKWRIAGGVYQYDPRTSTGILHVPPGHPITRPRARLWPRVTAPPALP